MTEQINESNVNEWSAKMGDVLPDETSQKLKSVMESKSTQLTGTPKN